MLHNHTLLAVSLANSSYVIRAKLEFFVVFFNKYIVILAMLIILSFLFCFRYYVMKSSRRAAKQLVMGRYEAS